MQFDPRKIEIPSKTTYKLETIRRVAAELDHPEQGRRTIIVGGTNGKGSTCVLLTRLFLSSGLKVGTFISPHVVHRTERISINGKPISEFTLRRYEKKYRRSLDSLSFFERYTILAFLIFRDYKVDLQILEVGLGGRLDATNISSPDISVITRIDYDHQAILGHTIQKIAKEKAGIMRKHGLVAFGAQRVAALRTLRARARQLNAEMIKMPPEDRQVLKTLGLIEQTRGVHQRQNAELAWTVYEKARRLWNLQLTTKDKCQALKGPLPHARIQVLKNKPLWIVDGSHNLNSLDALDKYLTAHFRDRKFTVIFGAMNDKDIVPMLRKVKPWAERVMIPLFYPERQMLPEKLKALWKKIGVKAESSNDLIQTLKQARDSKMPVLVVGSLYLAGAVLSQKGILEK